MKTNFNSTFKNLLDKYNLPSDLNLSIDLPIKIQELLLDNVIKNEFGACFAKFWTPASTDRQESQSFHEDSENHFHVDTYADIYSDKNAFEIGIKTMIELAKTLQKKNIDNVQLTYSFQSPDMGRTEAIKNNLHDDDDDEYFISDRLSFHTKRDGQIIVSDDLFDNRHCAFLTIDL